jgi:hypothetical protein
MRLIRTVYAAESTIYAATFSPIFNNVLVNILRNTLVSHPPTARFMRRSISAIEHLCGASGIVMHSLCAAAACDVGSLCGAYIALGPHKRYITDMGHTHLCAHRFKFMRLTSRIH